MASTGFLPFRVSGGLLILVLAGLVATIPVSPALAASQDGEASAEEQAADTEESSSPETFLEVITVTSTLNPRTLGETPGTVSVIGSERIEKELMSDIQDVVRYEPGVYVENDVTRLGLSGFNIRGIGGNRVTTQIDGIQTAERFDFGPFTSTQYAIDLEGIDAVEIIRSAGSSLYGSDALGGVVSLVTKSPADYLGANRSFIGLSTGFDGRDEEARANLTGAVGGDRWQSSLTATLRNGSETDNQGDASSENEFRTEPNPIDRDATSFLAKTHRRIGDSGEIGFAVEYFDGETDTSVLSSQRVSDFSFLVPPGGTFLVDIQDVDALDSQERLRLSVHQNLISSGRGAFDSLLWRAYAQDNSTEQVVVEQRVNTIGFGGPPSVQRVRRSGDFNFEQEGFGGEIVLRKAFGSGSRTHLLSYGASVVIDQFDGLRDRVDTDLDTGEIVPSSLLFPTKYFPESDVTEYGLFVQDEIELASGRLVLVPGVRFDSYDLDPLENDRVFLDGNPGQPTPVGISDSSISPKLGLIYEAGGGWLLTTQYARGFRAPPYSSVNNGFTNAAGGYTTLPNPDLEAETSDNFEIGLRRGGRGGSFSLTVFDNRYDDFIEFSTVGFNPATGLLEFQEQNVAEVEISGVELAGDAKLSDAWRLRAAFAVIEGDNETDDVPLNSIAPPQLVLGLAYQHPDGKWGSVVNATIADAKDEADIDRSSSNQFAPSGYEVLDVTAYYSITDQLDFQAGVFNLLDETYWQWFNVLGRTEGSATLDRYTSPGRSVAISLRYRG